MPPQQLVQEAIKSIVESILESKGADTTTMDTFSENLEGILHGLIALLAKNGGGPSGKGPSLKKKKGKGKGEKDEQTKKPTGAGRGNHMDQEPPWRSSSSK
eukprot:8589175-Heterocapsa_arctica.AAC.1